MVTSFVVSAGSGSANGAECRLPTRRRVKGHIVGTDVIMRAGEARESDPIGTFNKNESVEILKYVNNSNGEVWVRVRRNNGDKGFVFGKYLQKD